MGRVVLKRSRKSFFVGYIFLLLFSLIILSLYAMDTLSDFALYLISFPIVYLFLLPEYSKISTRYIIKEDNIEEISGIITKKRNIIPWSLVANVSMKKGIIGTMLDYGDIVVSTMSGGEGSIVMKGISNPKKILRKIEERIGKREIKH